MQLPSWAFCLPSLSLSLARLSSLKWQQHRQLMLPNVCWPRVGPCGRQGLLYGAAGPHLRSLAINYRPGAVQNRDPLPSVWPSSHLRQTKNSTPLNSPLHDCLPVGRNLQKITFSFHLNARPRYIIIEFQITLFRVNIVKRQQAFIQTTCHRPVEQTC